MDEVVKVEFGEFPDNIAGNIDEEKKMVFQETRGGEFLFDMR